MEFKEQDKKCLCPSGKDAKEPRMQIGKWSVWRESRGTLWEIDGKGRQADLDYFRAFLEVRSLVERGAYLKAFGTHG